MSVSDMALSQDGTMLAFVSPEENSALPMLYVQRIGSSSVTLLPGTEAQVIPSGRPTVPPLDSSRMASCRKWR